jgi:hypothetical protein
MHHGLVTAAGGEKMSKSLGNSVTVEQALATVPPAVLRYALGAAHYRSTIEWSDQVVADATAAYARIETFVRNATEAVGDAPVDESLSKVSWQEFATALDDDLGVPAAIATIHNGIRAGNALLADREIPSLAATLAVVRRMLGVLCLDPVADWPQSGGGQLSGVVDALVALAVEARAAGCLVRASAGGVGPRPDSRFLFCPPEPTGAPLRCEPGLAARPPAPPPPIFLPRGLPDAVMTASSGHHQRCPRARSRTRRAGPGWHLPASSPCARGPRREPRQPARRARRPRA